jgi:hypothetical protein
MNDDLVQRLNMVDATMNPMTLVIVAREAASRIEQLISGSGGIMEMKQTIADKEQEIEYLKADLRFWQECYSDDTTTLRVENEKLEAELLEWKARAVSLFNMVPGDTTVGELKNAKDAILKVIGDK